ncbi:hypothetical protein E0485_03060 [Paenibacillus albiflavus]|uniref:Uncharacterized protein n=1 Tax=Paenibacillus albiflavus TaxID=2545760 RepID=A0A4R4EN77_9BACL|nr:hypothetical protein [Paenibacillus albiflavus]TCZ68313.1 hypothetical protein E0485_24380 [Paenibacillus albiflavus]TCZ79865.1 hypothetical protein E0485_03060 [Paenibacillus albiflavus]
MKKNMIWYGLAAFIVLILGFILYMIYPTTVNFAVEGVKYRLGAENQNILKPVTIQVKGTMQKSLTGAKTFKGTLYIEGEEIPTAAEQKELIIEFDPKGQGYLAFPNPPTYKPPNLSYGMSYINSDFTQISITVHEKDLLNPGAGHWNSGDGLMIAAPAQNRADALHISNELMKPFLPSPLE